MSRRFMHYKDSTRPQTILQFPVRGNRSGAPQNKKNYWCASGKIVSTQWNIHKVPPELKQFHSTEIQSYRINENWSGDLEDVHQLANDNDGKKFAMVFVDCPNRFLPVEPIDNKSAKQARAALEKMTQKQKPEKIWVDKGKEFKREFAKLCLEKNITVYNTHSEQKSCFAERFVRTLKSILFKYLNENNTSKYFDQIQNFVSLINSRPNRTNRTTKTAPKKLPDTMYLT